MIVLGVDPRVVGRDLLRERVVGAEPFEQRLGGDAAHGEGRRPAGEIATAQAAVRVVVVEVEQFLIEVLGSFSVHGSLLRGWRDVDRARADGPVDHSPGSVLPSQPRGYFSLVLSRLDARGKAMPATEFIRR